MQFEATEVLGDEGCASRRSGYTQEGQLRILLQNAHPVCRKPYHKPYSETTNFPLTLRPHGNRPGRTSSLSRARPLKRKSLRVKSGHSQLSGDVGAQQRDLVMKTATSFRDTWSHENAKQRICNFVTDPSAWIENSRSLS